MEILMKLKCSPSAPGSAQHSTLKVVDHHHQLQQHTLASSPHVVPPPPLHSNAAQMAHMQQTRLPPPPPQEMLLPAACLEYATATMDCCSAAAAVAAAHRDMADLRYGSRHGVSEYGSVYSGGAYETPACCSGISSYGGVTTMSPSTLFPPQIHPELELNPTMSVADDYNTRYEYHEPEENFVSIDDAKIKGFLMRIGKEEQDARRVQEEEATITKVAHMEPDPIVFEIIELDDEEEHEKLMHIKNQAAVTKIPAPHAPPNYAHPNSKSPSISLIPKSPELPLKPQKTPSPTVSKQKIIAQIELLDSSSDEDNAAVDSERDDSEVDDDDGDEVLPAVPVSCELECVEEDDDDTDDVTEIVASNSVPGCSPSSASQQQTIIILPSDDDENGDFIDEQEEGVELRWDDLEEQKERTFFECFLCGKKVQSSYNLRRHMMIHTGERPFGCDMCDRRFREFSDLKKHRRRHANASNFVCMVCRVNTPTENDPTRCSSCDTKNGALIAASSRPQLATTAMPQHEEKQSETPPPPVKNPAVRTQAPLSVPPTIVYSSSTKSNSMASNCTAAAVPPPLTPVSPALTAETQLLLDTIPAVHRSAYNQLGTVTRREFPCPLCQRPFGTRHNLKRHFMIHTGEKPFACTKCRKPFREYSTLKKHMVTHIRDRWYKCLRCPQKYRDYIDYMAHRNTHPKEETPLSSFSASASSGSSATPSPKKRAKSRHDDSNDDDSDSGSEDWLECCECGQRFTDIEVYTEHLKEHDPSLHLFECYICKESFEQRDKLEKHVKEYHDYKDYHKNEKSTIHGCKEN